jgi:hypothetical protein
LGEVTFTLDSIFSGLYSPDTKPFDHAAPASPKLKNRLPVEFLRVPDEADVLM